jgi:putative ABC transport system ATP-binding protein
MTIPATVDAGRQPLIELHDVRRVFGKGESAVRALDGIDLVVREGDYLAVMGASGSGKSTCMNILGCLDRPTSGTYLFSGIDVGALTADQLALLRRHRIGFVFQGFNLLSRTTAVENVELPLIYQRVPAKERRRRALEALDQVGLSHRAKHSPNELSGGQQQRVAIARALVTSPSLVVADEPTGNLDSATSVEVMEMLVRLNKERGITIVMVTHEEDMAAYAGRIVVFVDGHITRDSLSGEGPFPGRRSRAE